MPATDDLSKINDYTEGHFGAAKNRRNHFRERRIIAKVSETQPVGRLGAWTARVIEGSCTCHATFRVPKAFYPILRGVQRMPFS